MVVFEEVGQAEGAEAKEVDHDDEESGFHITWVKFQGRENIYRKGKYARVGGREILATFKIYSH